MRYFLAALIVIPAFGAGPSLSPSLVDAANHDDLKAVEALIRAGNDVNAPNRYGVTPLSLACTNGDTAMVKALLGAKADPNLALPGGETPLMTCARTGDAEAVKALLAAGADVKAKDAER